MFKGTLNSFIKNTLKDEIITGTTPAKREYVCPSTPDLAATSPRERIIARYHHNHTGVISSPLAQEVERRVEVGITRDSDTELVASNEIVVEKEPSTPPTVPAGANRNRNDSSRNGGNIENSAELRDSGVKFEITTTKNVVNAVEQIFKCNDRENNSKLCKSRSNGSLSSQNKDCDNNDNKSSKIPASKNPALRRSRRTRCSKRTELGELNQN